MTAPKEKEQDERPERTRGENFLAIYIYIFFTLVSPLAGLQWPSLHALESGLAEGPACSTE